MIKVFMFFFDGALLWALWLIPAHVGLTYGEKVPYDWICLVWGLVWLTIICLRRALEVLNGANS